MKILSYSYEDEFDDVDEDKLVTNLLQTPDILRALNYPDFLHPTELQEASMIIEIQDIPCSILSMDFFDKIFDFGLVLEDGTIRKCFEDYVDDIVIADELRNMVLVDESDNYSMFGGEERDQFLFRIFQHLIVGGRLNQYEDNIKPYLMMTKRLYKDLVCVRKTGSLKDITIISKVFKVECKINGKPVVPSRSMHSQDFLYLIINPTLKYVTLFRNFW